MIRIVSTGMTSTLNYGGVWVTVDPWPADCLKTKRN